jgi:hypothetical protein
MKAVLWLVVGLLVGVVVGWYVHSISAPDIRASASFTFVDELADRQYPYLLAKGSWRGGNLANKTNTVRIVCDASEKHCELHRADVMSLGSSGPFLSLYNNTFRITKVDAQSVVAQQSLADVCIRQTLTFDRIAKAVTMVRSKINREDTCSVVQNDPVTLFLGEPLGGP